MKPTLLLASLLVMVMSARSQTFSVQGQLANPAKTKTEAATVSLLRTNQSLVKSSLTDSTGAFHINNITPGKYLVSISAVGFTTWQSDTLQLREDVDLGAITLTRSDKSLQEITVTAKKPMIEVKADKTIVNVDAFVSNAGNNALEVLEKSPGVTVDRDGNISLKGKQGVIVLIDGKQTYLSGTQLADLLRNTPANQLETLEIMTQPSAKYDAAGNSGIINIRTKKGRQNGFNGSLTLGYIQGKYPKSPNSLNLNFKKNRWNLFTNLNYAHWSGFSNVNIKRNFLTAANGDEVNAVFDQQTRQRFWGKSIGGRIGADYQVTQKTTVGVQFSGNYNPRDYQAEGQADIYDGNLQLDATNRAISTSYDPWKNWGSNLNFRTKLDSTGRELTADLDYLQYRSRNTQQSNNFTYQHPGNSLTDSLLLHGELPSDIDIYSAKIDYVHPIGKKAKLELGAKSSWVTTDNDARYTLWDNKDGGYQPDPTRSNHFVYRENINAGYVNFNREFSRWSFQSGLRLEHTYATGKQLTNNESFRRNYAQLFPTLYLSYNLDSINKLNLSYGRRIERPNYQDMNPFQYFLDQYTFRRGNPNLVPQFSNNIELSHNFKSVLNTTLNFTSTTNIINDILVQNDSTKVTYQTKENIAKMRSFGLSVNYNQSITKWWTVSLFVNGFNNHFNGVVSGLPLDVSLWGYMGNINNQFRFSKGWGAELSGFYRSKMQDGGLIVSLPMGVISAGASKQILKGKGTLKLSLNDPFYIQYFRGYTRFGTMDTHIRSKWDNRRVGISFVYRFGKQQAGAQRRRSNGASDEERRVGGNQQ